MYKKVLVLITALFFFSACADSMTLPTTNGEHVKRYDSVGLFNTLNKADHVCYSVIVGNAIWSIILVETVVFPVYFIGWSILEPVGLKKDMPNPGGCW